MANQKNLILRKKINEVLYDLMVKTISDQVYVSDTKTLTMALSELEQSLTDKAGTAELTALETKFNNLIQDAPEAYDTLKEIGDYISTHQSEYQALLAISQNKVDKEEGKGLSTNDFTNELKTKLEELYDKATLDEKFSGITTRLDALEAGVGPTELDAANVSYTNGNGEKITVKAALDELLYVPITVNVSSPTATTQEKGASLENLVINWTYNKDKVVKQSINGQNLTDLSQRSYTDPGPVTTNKTYTVVGEDGTKSASKAITFSFKNKVYWGVSENNDAGVVNSAFILGLTGNKFADSKSNVGSITANAASGQYIYYAQPASFGDPIFNIGGFDTTFDTFATIDFTNASGYTESYKVFKSGQAGLGSTSMTVK